MRKLIAWAALLLIPSIASAQVGSTKFVSATPTVDTSAYATGELIGGKLTFTQALKQTVGTGYVIGVVITDKAATAVDLELWLFKQDPTSTTFTDQAAFDPADADLSKVSTIISFGSGTRFAAADNGIKYVGSILHPIAGYDSAGRPDGTMYGALISRGAPTFASASDVTVTLEVSQD